MTISMPGAGGWGGCEDLGRWAAPCIPVSATATRPANKAVRRRLAIPYLNSPWCNSICIRAALHPARRRCSSLEIF